MPIARLFATLLFLCCASLARADALDDTLAKFLDDKFPRTEQAIGELAASGAANAPAILEALGDNRLLIDPVAHVLVYRT
jgi:urea transport system permease protein